tara:strand:+ start:373 stop:699 length:327 start_codon:yes stop_codon:yes gene_type:complete
VIKLGRLDRRKCRQREFHNSALLPPSDLTQDAALTYSIVARQRDVPDLHIRKCSLDSRYISAMFICQELRRERNQLPCPLANESLLRAKNVPDAIAYAAGKINDHMSS